MLESWGRLVTFELFQHCYQQHTLESTPLDPIIVRLLEKMTLWIDRPARLEELARQAGFSPQHMNRIFHRALGSTPLKYLTRLKIERAAELLIETNRTVETIAASVGFEDPYYFSRVFKREVGRSPAAFRLGGTGLTS